jgi:putative hydrolase of the HAD superfamily
LKKYEHLFFDLDHTLWDFERNSQETIYELFTALQLGKLIPSAADVYTSFKEINRFLWDEYHLDKISKEALRKRRFEMVLEQNGVRDESLAEEFSDLYLERCPQKSYLIPHTIEILDYLKDRYMLHVLSNGFEETTKQKLASSALGTYFKTVCTPSHSGYKKPDSEMFLFAMQMANATVSNSLMIGDDLQADILGAKKCGISQVYFNPEQKKHEHLLSYEIKSILELKELL